MLHIYTCTLINILRVYLVSCSFSSIFLQVYYVVSINSINLLGFFDLMFICESRVITLATGNFYYRYVFSILKILINCSINWIFKYRSFVLLQQISFLKNIFILKTLSLIELENINWTFVVYVQVICPNNRDIPEHNYP